MKSLLPLVTRNLGIFWMIKRMVMFESDEEDCQSTFPEESSKPSDQTIQARTYSINIRIGIAKNHDQGEGEALHPSTAMVCRHRVHIKRVEKGLAMPTFICS